MRARGIMLIEVVKLSHGKVVVESLTWHQNATCLPLQMLVRTMNFVPET